MSDPTKELEQLDKKGERLEGERDDAWNRMDVIKGRLQKIEDDLRSDISPGVRQSLEKEQVGLRIDYMRADRTVHDIDKQFLEMGLRYQALGVAPQDDRDDLIARRDALIWKLEKDKSSLLEMRAEKSVIGTNHYLQEMELAQKELAIIARKLGESPFLQKSREPDSGPELEPSEIDRKKGRDFGPEF